ncbi:MAG TPA: hypothetical protein VKZ49_02825 [Polyangiaceae bacterium]|nr:hypothetical protein [Polyangiaceae bacterium]
MRFGQRVLVLCRAHALIARNSGVRSLAALRELYHESDGQRSYVPRRSLGHDTDRGRGRRATDARA